uniref:Uncharacterized protein n=1 Tax=Panagrolaimus sp. ES5 TaxID=591445 RepID=A0AC34F0R4_9BILA
NFIGEVGYSRSGNPFLLYCSNNCGRDFYVYVLTSGRNTAYCRECKKLVAAEKKKFGPKFVLKYLKVCGAQFTNDNPLLVSNHHHMCVPLSAEQKLEEQSINNFFTELKTTSVDFTPETLYEHYATVMVTYGRLDNDAEKVRKTTASLWKVYKESRSQPSTSLLPLTRKRRSSQALNAFAERPPRRVKRLRMDPSPSPPVGPSNSSQGIIFFDKCFETELFVFP